MKKHTQNVLTSILGVLFLIAAILLLGSDSYSIMVFLWTKIIGVGLLFMMLLAFMWEAGE